MMAADARAPFQYPIRRLTVRSCKVSKPRDLYLELSDRSEIWQALWQQGCQSVCQISKGCNNLYYQSRCFETSRDLTIGLLSDIETGLRFLVSLSSLVMVLIIQDQPVPVLYEYKYFTYLCCLIATKYRNANIINPASKVLYCFMLSGKVIYIFSVLTFEIVVHIYVVSTDSSWSSLSYNNQLNKQQMDHGN